jgi:hypothetical protein
MGEDCARLVFKVDMRFFDRASRALLARQGELRNNESHSEAQTINFNTNTKQLHWKSFGWLQY